MQNRDSHCVCIIGARKGSKRLPAKNRLPVSGHPLYHFTLVAALESGIFDQTIFSTDDEVILSDLAEHKDILLDTREPEFAGDDVTMMDVTLNLLHKYDGFFTDVKDIGILSPCSPLRRPEHLIEAYQLYKQHQALSLVSVTEFPCPPELALEFENHKVYRKWKGPAHPGNYKKRYYPNGAITFVDFGYFTKHKEFYSPDTFGYVMSWPACIDIDEQADYEVARMIMENSYRRES